MPDFRRHRVPGGCYFFTDNLLQRRGNTLLADRIDLLRDAVRRVRQSRPFVIDAWVVLPDHLHAVWTLPPGDADFSTRWRPIKTVFARGLPKTERLSRVRHANGERGIWQRRFWEHAIRDDEDFAAHVDYVHFNPVKHGLVASPADWPYSPSGPASTAAGIHLTGSAAASRISKQANPADEIIRRNTPAAIPTYADCLSLLYWRQIGAASGEDQPKCADLMKVLGDTEKVRLSLTGRIDTTRVDAISTAVPKPEIELSYCDGERQISFEKASEGQRAAALLFMLLEQSGGPLIIDQPEGDLDNRIITELTNKLHSAKQKRQLIFVSHNANIVVNGSSELVIHLDIDDSGDRKITCAGAIDKPEVCRIITATMEGGEKAFKDRQDKYGY